jgi:hypothetical protein
MANPKLMKVSDEEREEALQALSRALSTGRIGYEDFETRVDRVLAAENYIELGEVVVDLPVRAPRPPSEPPRYDYLPINAPPRSVPLTAEGAGGELDRRMWPSRGLVVAVMSLRALLVFVAAAFVDEKLLADVLPSASPVASVGVILIALATLFAVYNAVACKAAIPPKLARPSDDATPLHNPIQDGASERKQ